MKLNACVVAAAAAAFALPLAQHASAQAGGPSGASAMGTGPTGGVPRTGGPGPAVASTGEPLGFTGHPIRGFSEVDANGDGYISRAEWQNYVRPGREGTDTGRNVPFSYGPTTGGASAGGTGGLPTEPRNPSR